MSKKEDISKKINELESHMQDLINELNKVEGELNEYKDTYLSMDETMTKVECPKCGSKGLISNVCNGKGYIWMKKFESGGL